MEWCRGVVEGNMGLALFVMVHGLGTCHASYRTSSSAYYH